MTPFSNPMVRTAADKFQTWRRSHRERRELASLDSEVFCAVARDVCVSSAELELLAKSGQAGAANLERLFGVLGIEGEVISRAEPAVMRDMERVCALCPAKVRCERDLRAAASPRTYREYCPNSATIDAL